MRIQKSIMSVMVFGALIAGACLPSPSTDTKGTHTITVYGFSIVKEVLEKDIYPGFAANWKKEHADEAAFVSSFAGSETITNQILQGAPADIAILSIDRAAQRLSEGKATTSDWHAYPNKGIVNKTPFVILIRKGNPKGIQDFPDLAKPLFSFAIFSILFFARDWLETD